MAHDEIITLTEKDPTRLKLTSHTSFESLSYRQTPCGALDCNYKSNAVAVSIACNFFFIQGIG